MLRKKKDPKGKKSVADTLLRDMQGTAAEKLAALEKVLAWEFAGMDRRELLKIENMLRTFAATESSDGYRDRLGRMEPKSKAEYMTTRKIISATTMTAATTSAPGETRRLSRKFRGNLSICRPESHSVERKPRSALRRVRG